MVIWPTMSACPVTDLNLGRYKTIFSRTWGARSPASDYRCPNYDGKLEWDELGEQLRAAFQFTTISSTQARREFLIAPILSDICRRIRQKVRVE